MSEVVDPGCLGIAETFVRVPNPDEPDAYEYWAWNTDVASPPYAVAMGVLYGVNRPEDIVMPEGWDAGRLRRIRWGLEGGTAVTFSIEEAGALAAIGSQVLALHAAGNVLPPLSPMRERAIRFLIAQTVQDDKN
ncbi:MAG TPA: hypothetical protein VLF69_02730 [Candidatus Saccharimonadales bacterium]|nr:hypothetical protein [Candidatus Saccharimonadales bacterium]